MRDYQLYIDDMIDSATRILEYTRGLSFEQFEQNQMMIDAVNRNLEIIGEASTHITDDLQALFPEVPWRSIRGMRNILIHEYWGSDLHIIWKTIQESLPHLLRALGNSEIA